MLRLICIHPFLPEPDGVSQPLARSYHRCTSPGAYAVGRHSIVKVHGKIPSMSRHRDRLFYPLSLKVFRFQMVAQINRSSLMHHAQGTSSKRVSHLVGSENIRFATSFFWRTIFQIHAQVANLSIVLLHNIKPGVSTNHTCSWPHIWHY